MDRCLKAVLFVLLAAHAAVAENALPRPIVLVPGWGYKYSKLVLGQKVFDPYVKWMTESGFPRDRIHLVDYNSMGDIPGIQAHLVSQMKQILSGYPPGTKIDVMGHSLGGFTGFYAVAAGGFADRVQKFVSLAGIPMGWDGFDICRVGLCGRAHTHLIPFHSPFIEGMLGAYASEIKKFDKCSLFSPDDEFVSPYDAGRFEDGTNVELPGLKHMDVIWDRSAFDALVKECYGGSLLPNP